MMARLEFPRKVRQQIIDRAQIDERIRASFSYDPETGRLEWRNTGREVTGFSDDGYRRAKVCKKTLMAHRIAWMLHYGAWPDGILDHINGEKGDNRISNLRIVNSRENGMNRRLNSNSTSGFPGVYWAPRQRAWKVHIRKDGKHFHLGYFKDKDAAIATRRKAENEAGYSELHGRVTHA